LMAVAVHMAGNENMALDYRKKALAQDPNIEKSVVFHLELEKPPATKAAETPAAKVPESPAAKTP
jgi:hypothetical protein